MRGSEAHSKRDTPSDLGAHQRFRSSGFVHASKTIRAGALKVRVTTSSRSDFRSTVVAPLTVPSLAPGCGIGLLLSFQFLDEVVELLEPLVPYAAIAIEPVVKLLQRLGAKPV